MDNNVYSSLLNPVKLYRVDRSTTSKYQTRHFDDFKFEERRYFWQIYERYKRIWQTTDIVNQQFTSMIDPLIFELLDQYGIPIITLPMLVGMPNKFIPNSHLYEANMSLADLPAGCYYFRLSAGSGDSIEYYESDFYYIADIIPGSIFIDYWHSRFKDMVVFESGIKFGRRMMGNVGRLKPGKIAEYMKDEKYNATLLSSRSFRQFPIQFGDQFGIPDDEVDFLNGVWGVQNVLIDKKNFCCAGDDFVFVEVDNKAMRGCSLLVEEGINRRWSVFTTNSDPTKKLSVAVFVEAKVFGDTSNQGSSNTVPLIDVE